MPDWPTLSPFVAASMSLLIAPGPAVLYIVARSLDKRRRAGIMSTLGIGTGTLVHAAAANAEAVTWDPATGDAATGDAARERYLIRLQPVPRLVKAENWTDRENEIVAEHFRGLKKRLAGS
jgi:hypothetical protein